MNRQTLKQQFLSLVAPDQPNEWEVDEAVEPLLTMEAETLQAVLAQVPVIWPVSNALCYDYLRSVQPALACIELANLPSWVNETLDHYEKKGLRAAQIVMQDVENHSACAHSGRKLLKFEQAVSRLQPYINGIAGQTMDLLPAKQAYTDTCRIFLAGKIDCMAREEEAFLLYKYMVSLQWAFCAIGTFDLESNEPGQEEEVREGGEHPLAAFFRTFSSPPAAASLYHCFETIRAAAFLTSELPGLMREVGRLLSPVREAEEMVNGLIAYLQQGIVTGLWPVPANSLEKRAGELAVECRNGMDGRCSREATQELFLLSGKLGLSIEPGQPTLLQGELRLQEVQEARARRRAEQQEQFIDSLASHLLILPEYDPQQQGDQTEDRSEGVAAGNPDSALIVGNRSSTVEENGPLGSIRVNNQDVELSDELQHLAEQIVEDLGYLPDHYIASAAGKAGRGVAALHGEGEQDGREIQAPVVYDEWDYRRKGFRKNWCVLKEKELPQVRSSFIANTLNKYHGQIVRLRHQFEMMQTQERFVRRQRDGDDIDLDALVESLGDTRAGLPPSDRLFIRLRRDERDIAVLFLVDMSNSTEGWVGTAIKEALVLISEAMEALGDRYGIYGFSGMRRLRCEIFPIKDLEEPYSEQVRNRIGAIGPREYTRMAPAVRHMTGLLKQVDARVRLLVTLSDGKPEDYDGYKGEYAIEDTRHALLEAKSAGIHPFCITIDRHAHDYMAHMYGEVNYIFIDNVKRLPARMPEIYRTLTT